MAKKRKKDNYYVDNDEFYELLCLNKKLHEQEHILTKMQKIDEVKLIQEKRRRVKNKLGRIYLKICNGVLTKANFINYSKDRKDEMISDATFYMSKYTLLYKLHLKNPFAYFTTISRNAFIQNINKYNKISNNFQTLSYIENLHVENNMGIEDVE